MGSVSVYATIPNDQLATIDHLANGAATHTGTYDECDAWCDTQPTGNYRIIQLTDIEWRDGSDADLIHAAARVDAARIELDAAMRRARAKGQPLRHIAEVAGVTHETIRTRTSEKAYRNIK